MALRIVEFFGYAPGDPAARPFSDAAQCPFTGTKCIKPKHGACSMESLEDQIPVICCPQRLYVDSHAFLGTVAGLAFGDGTVLLTPDKVRALIAKEELNGDEVAVYGKGWGGELPLPKSRDSEGAYYVDWILAHFGADGEIRNMTAIEVQTIDTTGSYGHQAIPMFKGHRFTDASGRKPGYSNAGFNWENVNKRILPQLIYKGHVLRREKFATRGMFFCCPKQVADRVFRRLGGREHILDYYPSPGTITFVSYILGPEAAKGSVRDIVVDNTFTTTVDQVAMAFTSPRWLPEKDVYAKAVMKGIT